MDFRKRIKKLIMIYYMLIDLNAGLNEPRLYISDNENYIKENMKIFKCFIYLIKTKKPVNKWIYEYNLKDYL